MALLLACLAATDVRIESVERLIGNVQRPFYWAPLAVKVTSAGGFEGELVVHSSMGIRVARTIRLAAGGSDTFLLPAIDPQRITAGAATFEIPQKLGTPDFVVLVDARLSYAGELVSDSKVAYRTIEPSDLEKLLALGVLDACDLLLVKEAAGLPLGSVWAWAVAPTRPEAEKAVAERLKSWEPPGLVDLELWALAPEGGWVPAKKDRAILFAALYALVGFSVLAFAGRAHARLAPAAVAGLSALGVLSFLLFFPRHHLWISERSCEIVPAEGDAMLLRLWFAGASAEVTTSIEFPRVVKPVFSKFGDTSDPITIRVLAQGGSLIEGLRIPAGRSLCFVGVEGRAPTMRATERVAQDLYGAVVRRGGEDRFVGDLLAGSAVPRAPAGPPPPETDERVWFRFLKADGVAGRLDRAARVADDVGSPDLADGRKRPRSFIQRFP